MYGAGSERLRAVDGPWYLGDALGSVRTTLDDAGAVVATASYDPWGTPQGDLVAPFGFTGELHHGDQVYLRARWYTPGWGTFPSRDPFAGFPEMPYSLHAYQYAYSAPTMWTDPSGECVFAVVDTIVCVGGVTFTIGQAIALVTAVGSATAATYDACVTQGGCRQLALDLERALESLGSSTPPLDPGPPESPVLRGAPQYVPARDDHLVSSPLTGPEEACGVIPGPLLMPPPGPFTTGAPLDPVQGPVVWMAGQLPLFDQAGITYTNHLQDQLRARNISESEALDAFLDGDNYMRYVDGTWLPVSHNPKTGVTVAVDKAIRLVTTVFERGPKGNGWRPGWSGDVTWYPPKRP